jgi:4a-hydroxytetrahydrobiopterin dehydratase
MAEKLSGDARSRALARLKGWSEVKGRDAITKKFVFQDFNQAFGFMTRAALVAGGVTELDVKLAETMDKLAG